jgi:hypothetical protein
VRVLPGARHLIEPSGSKQRVESSPGAPLCSPESSSCTHFQSNFISDFRPIPSNNGIFRRKLEAQTVTDT